MKGVRLLTRWRSRGAVRVSLMEGYARWAARYPAHPHNPLMEAEASIVEPLLRHLAPRRALDVGTGTGRNLHLLRSVGASFVAGIDLSESMLSHGHAPCPRVRGDAQQLPFQPGTFDLVSSSLMCGDVRDLGAWTAEAARVLEAGGHLVYSDFHPSWAAAGWRRTFTGDDDREYELPFFPHPIEMHVHMLESAGFALRVVREPKVEGRPTPVVVVFHAVKPGCRSRRC